MFGMKKKALMNRIAELERELVQQKQRSEKDAAELAAYREHKALRERTFEELRMAMEKRIEDLDERILAFEHTKAEESHRLQLQKAELQKNLQEEVETTRQTLREEIGSAQDATRQTLLSSIEAFDHTYNYYLSQIQKQMEQLSRAAMKVGGSFFESDAQGLQQMFHSQMQAIAPVQEDEVLQPEAEALPAQEPVVQSFEVLEEIAQDETVDPDERIRQLMNILNDHSPA